MYIASKCGASRESGTEEKCKESQKTMSFLEAVSRDWDEDTNRD